MASLYLETPSGICVYYNRKPDYNGMAAPITVEQAILFILMFGITICDILLTGDSTENSLGTLQILALLAIAVSIVIWFESYFHHIFFSTDTKEVFRVAYFRKKKLASFDEMGEIKIQSDDDDVRYSVCVITWRFEMYREPLRLSAKCGDIEELCSYEQIIIPALRGILPQSSTEGGSGDNC